jgi:hypothetical protein
MNTEVAIGVFASQFVVLWLEDSVLIEFLGSLQVFAATAVKVGPKKSIPYNFRFFFKLPFATAESLKMRKAPKKTKNKLFLVAGPEACRFARC